MQFYHYSIHIKLWGLNNDYTLFKILYNYYSIPMNNDYTVFSIYKYCIMMIIQILANHPEFKQSKYQEILARYKSDNLLKLKLLLNEYQYSNNYAFNS